MKEEAEKKEKEIVREQQAHQTVLPVFITPPSFALVYARLT